VIDISPRDLIEAWTFVIGAVLSEAGDAAIDDARIDLADALVIDAEFCFDVGPEVLDDDVGPPGQAVEDLEALRLLQVERHRSLVAVQVLEVRAVPRPTHLLAAGLLQQCIDLDDVRTPIRQLPHAGRAGPDAGEIEHGKARQGLRGARDGHSGDSGRSEPQIRLCLIVQNGAKFNSRNRSRERGRNAARKGRFVSDDAVLSGISGTSNRIALKGSHSGASHSLAPRLVEWMVFARAKASILVAA
jgi:hypothetical protein